MFKECELLHRFRRVSTHDLQQKEAEPMKWTNPPFPFFFFIKKRFYVWKYYFLPQMQWIFTDIQSAGFFQGGRHSNLKENKHK